MILRQAYKAWSEAPRNMLLARKSKDAVDKVLMKKYGSTELNDFTYSFTEKIFSESTEQQEVKTKAASILVYVLCWGGDNGYCSRPTFDYTIANNEPATEPTEDEEPVVKVKPDVLAARLQELKKRKGKTPRHVVQIDKNTLEPIKVWHSVRDIYVQLGVRNIARAIERKGLAGGFFWCDEGDEKHFKPNRSAVEVKTKSAQAVISEEQKNDFMNDSKQEKVPVGIMQDGTVVLQEKIDITKVSNEELIAEIRRRGWSGKISFTVSVEL